MKDVEDVSTEKDISAADLFLRDWNETKEEESNKGEKEGKALDVKDPSLDHPQNKPNQEHLGSKGVGMVVLVEVFESSGDISCMFKGLQSTITNDRLCSRR